MKYTKVHYFVELSNPSEEYYIQLTTKLYLKKKKYFNISIHN